MKYTVTLYVKGKPMVRREVVATSYKKAMILVSSTSFVSWGHAKVEGKTVKRFNNKFKVIPNECQIFKNNSQMQYNILLMFGTHPEFISFEKREKRDEVYEKCMTFTPVGSAKTSKEPSDTTVSSDETSDSKNGSTSMKIWNGFVLTATQEAMLTQDNIDKTSGTGKSKSSEEFTWTTGYKVSRSKPSPIFATVKNAPEKYTQHPGSNSKMASMNGETMEVKKNGMLYNGNNFLWLPEWLDFSNVILQVKDMPLKTVYVSDGTTVSYTAAHKKMAGKTISLRLCGCGCKMYRYGELYFPAYWLRIPIERKVKKISNKIIYHEYWKVEEPCP